METAEEYYRSYLSGNESAFDHIIELYRENLIFFLLRYLPSVEDAEDIAEDSFVELLLGKFKLGGKASLKTYLFTVGRNKALNFIKHQRRLPELRQEAEGVSLEEKVVRDEKNLRISRELQKLKPEYREVLHLLYFEELTLEETAQVMKKNKKQVENLSCRGKKAMRERLGEEALFCEN